MAESQILPEFALCCSSKELALNEVVQFLSSDQPRSISLPPIKPKGGEVYLFMASNENCKGELQWLG